MNWTSFDKLWYIITQPTQINPPAQTKFSYSVLLTSYFWTICLICTPPAFTFLLALNTLLSWGVHTLVLVPASAVTSLIFVYWATVVMTLYDKMRLML